MSSIKSIFIDCVDSIYNAEYIMQKFYSSQIASISHITLIPIRMTSGISNKAYINIAYWHDSETAYNFIKGLKTPNVENRFVHDSAIGLWWSVKINYKLYMTQDERFKKYTHTNRAFEYQNEIDLSLDKNIKKISILSKEPKVLPKILPKVEVVKPNTNTTGAKLLAYLNVKDDQEWIEIEKELKESLLFMQNQYSEWIEIEKELNNARFMMYNLEYKF
jgi:hypothetical protein